MSYERPLLNNERVTVICIRGGLELLDLLGVPTFPLNTDGIDVSGERVEIARVNITNYDDAVIPPTRGPARRLPPPPPPPLRLARCAWSKT